MARRRPPVSRYPREAVRSLSAGGAAPRHPSKTTPPGEQMGRVVYQKRHLSGIEGRMLSHLRIEAQMVHAAVGLQGLLLDSDRV